MATKRIKILKEKMLLIPRYVSIEQAKIITRVYKENENESRIIKRALCLKEALENIKIQIDSKELIVGNRTAGVRHGVVFPESGSDWVDKEFETIPTRNQDKFNVKKEDIQFFRENIKPYWEGKSLEYILKKTYGSEISKISKVVKINQKDHAQGHICPNVEKWLKKGPVQITNDAKKNIEKLNEKYKNKKQFTEYDKQKIDFYKSVVIVMDAVCVFINRYSNLLIQKANICSDKSDKENMIKLSKICSNLTKRSAKTYYEAVQSMWFLFVVLHMESNASSFSPGRIDKILYPYYKKDIENKTLNKKFALEIMECLWLKFNQIVYLRNKNSAKFFAGFPIGFNVALGGVDSENNDYLNEVSYICLKAQEEIGLPQPNLSVRLNKNTDENFLKQSIKVVSKGSGMPQFFNDKAIIPALENLGIDKIDARDYAIVGCVELTTQGNNLGWSDAAMFNLNKVLELTLNGGKCLITGETLAPNYGDLTEYKTFEQLENAFKKMMDYFIEKMILACEEVEKVHINLLPSPFLSSVIDNCIEKGIDVTNGGAKYNLSGIQMIQIANLADSLAAIKSLVFDNKKINQNQLLNALKTNFKEDKIIRLRLLNKVPKYGNDVEWVDDLGVKWAKYFKQKLSTYTNYRGGKYHTGMYTVSAHIPMGKNVGASADGRFSKEPLADGGMSPVYGRDVNGPTAVLKSVSRIDKNLTSNGGLLNMKFLPEFFETETGIDKFSKMMRAFVDLEIPHVQFNVVKKEDLLNAQNEPEKYKSLTIRVAGYTAYFTELAKELQDEIIKRTSYNNI